MSSSTPPAPGRLTLSGAEGRKQLLGTQVERSIRQYIAHRGLVEGDDLPPEGQIAALREMC